MGLLIRSDVFFQNPKKTTIRFFALFHTFSWIMIYTAWYRASHDLAPRVSVRLRTTPNVSAPPPAQCQVVTTDGKVPYCNPNKSFIILVKGKTQPSAQKIKNSDRNTVKTPQLNIMLCCNCSVRVINRAILVLELILVLVFILFWVNNFYFYIVLVQPKSIVLVFI